MNRSERSRRQGVALIYILVCFVVLLGFCSLGVDLGHVQVVKTELRRAADAAARAAVGELPLDIGTAQTRARYYAGLNVADGTAVVLEPATDVEFGTWDTADRTFTLLSGSDRMRANAVRVNAHRTAARGTPVRLLFASAIGQSACDVHASAVAAYVATPRAAGFIGITSVQLNGTTLIDSYNSDNGPYTSASARSNASVQTNGDMRFVGTVDIMGSARQLAGQPQMGPSVTVTGSTEPTGVTLYYPPPSAGSYDTYNDNSSIPPAYISSGNLAVNNGTLNIPSGIYYFQNVDFGGNSTINITGPVTLYVNGSFTLSGGSTVANNLPVNFKIRMVNAGSVTLRGTTAMYADIYAPLSDVSIGGGSSFFGTAIGNTLSLNGNGNIHYDESLAGTGGNPIVTLVQ